ncbi:MAG: hypothetical protein PHW95_03275 [Patescibacteria group bacterium]|nr:hypothetical protein [Patescibacteria group bacterium]
MKIVIIGSLAKGDEIRKSWLDWKPGYLKVLSQIPGVEINDGDEWQDESKPVITVGHDAQMIKICDVVIVNAEIKLGAGTAMEIMIAKYFSKPVITVLPRNSHHRRRDVWFEGKIIEDWIHPFIFVVSDAIIENIDQVYDQLDQLQKGKMSVKGISVIDDAITQYLKLISQK